MTPLTLVTTCMGRLAFLRRTLPAMVALPGTRVLLVDYSCPDHCGDWATEHYPGVTIVRVPGESTFSTARARNRGAAAAEEEILVFLDSDVLPAPGLADHVRTHLRPDRYLRLHEAAEGVWGSMAVHRSDFLRVGGFDEVYRGWGEEDLDFFDTLEFAGVEPLVLPVTLLQHLPHPPSARHELRREDQPGRRWAINCAYRAVKFDLMRLSRAPLPLAYREKLYAGIEAGLTAQPDRLVIELPGETPLTNGWGISRRLTYQLRPNRNPAKGEP